VGKVDHPCKLVLVASRDILLDTPLQAGHIEGCWRYCRGDSDHVSSSIVKDDIKTLILAGGRGTRAYPHTDYLPKPMLPVNGQPIITHVMRLFADQGYRRFVLSIGYRGEVIVDYFANKSLSWQIEIVPTGDDTDTGGRIARCQHLLGETFMATYSDGLAKIELDDLVAFHRSHGGLVTVTSVPMTSQYGAIESAEDGRILRFTEKPTLPGHWINAGFMVFERGVFRHWEGDNLEREVLPRLCEKGLAYTYRSQALFKSMDTHKDQQDIEELCRSGKFP